MKKIIALSLILSVIACKKSPEKPDQTSNKPQIETENIKPDLNKNYWHLEGSIGDYRIALELIKTHSLPETGGENSQEYFTANYYYLDQERPINLYQTDTAFVNNILNLSGFIDNKDEILSGTFDGLTYKGEWSSNGKKENFELKETYKNGATKFKFHSLNKNIPAGKNQASYQLQFTSVENNNLINDTIKSVMFGKTQNGDFAALISENFEDYKKHYLTEVNDLKKEMPNEEFSGILDFTNTKSIFPIVNSENRLILESYFYDYTGGAHGMHGSYFYNYDKAKGKFLTFNDIFKTNKTDLGKIITNEIRKKYKAKPNQKLSEIPSNDASFIVEEANYTDNFKITKKGIIFYYNVYELTPYAMGPYEILIGYDVLKSKLKADFKY